MAEFNWPKCIPDGLEDAITRSCNSCSLAEAEAAAAELELDELCGGLKNGDLAAENPGGNDGAAGMNPGGYRPEATAAARWAGRPAPATPLSSWAGKPGGNPGMN